LDDGCVVDGSSDSALLSLDDAAMAFVQSVFSDSALGDETSTCGGDERTGKQKNKNIIFVTRNRLTFENEEENFFIYFMSSKVAKFFFFFLMS
jgi:hypothetical protein